MANITNNQHTKVGNNCGVPYLVACLATRGGSNYSGSTLEEKCFIGFNAQLVGKIKDGYNVVIVDNAFGTKNLENYAKWQHC